MLLVLLLLIGTIAQAQEASFADLEGGAWLLSEIDEGRPPLPTLPVLVVFADGVLSGSAGCNDYRADAAVGDASALDVGSIYATRRACEPLIAAQEDEFLAKLQGVTAVGFRDGDLILDYWLDWVDGRWGTMRFERLRPPERLIGTSWRWVRYEDPLVGGVDLPDPEAFRLTFTDRGRLTIASDCLDADLPYAIDGSIVAINTRGLDLSGCTGDSPSWRLVGDLEAVRLASFSEGRLLLELFADSGALLFEPAP
jgi:heat shock protein HslJ